MLSAGRGLLQGTLELLILKTLTWEPMHGYGIASRIERATDDALRVEEGSLYPALYRMERKGWVSSEVGVSDNNRRAKFYRLTDEGRRLFQAEVQGWERLSGAVSRALEAVEAPG